jgi:hypothetical protein
MISVMKFGLTRRSRTGRTASSLVAILLLRIHRGTVVRHGGSAGPPPKADEL